MCTSMRHWVSFPAAGGLSLVRGRLNPFHLLTRCLPCRYVESDRQQLATDSDGTVSVYFKGELESEWLAAQHNLHVSEMPFAS